MHDVGFVVAGYTLTAVALGGYYAILVGRGRRARLRAAGIASRRESPAGS
jgi:hypothetical protein